MINLKMYAIQKWWEKPLQKKGEKPHERSHQEKAGRELGLGLHFHPFLVKNEPFLIHPS